jgi:hypothetical protein
MITANVAPTAKTPTEAVINNTVTIAGSVSLRGQGAGNSRLISVWHKLGHWQYQLRTLGVKYGQYRHVQMDKSKTQNKMGAQITGRLCVLGGVHAHATPVTIPQLPFEFGGATLALA